MSTFKKKGEVQLINGGYLSSKTGKPVSNAAFVNAQQKAHWLVTLASKMAGKTFTVASPDDINDLIAQTDQEINGNSVEEFIKTPKAPVSKITKALEEEALGFVEFHKEVAVSERINNKLQEFKVISEFENFGLFFNSGVVKLNEIYTVKQITEAAKVVYAVI